jgi:excinuclease ABC subunit B
MARSSRSLIQVAGRAARNAEGRVILYADKITDAMQELLSVTENRRRIQMAYNEAHGIVPRTIQKKKQETIENAIFDMAENAPEGILKAGEKRASYNAGSNVPDCSLDEIISELEREMLQAAEALEFERAAQLRDKIRELETKGLPSQTQKKSSYRRK